MSVRLAKPEHEVAYQDLVILLNKHAGTLSAVEMLAVAANMLGKLVAMQDQRSVTIEQAMKIVAMNIEQGNQMMVERLTQQTAGRA